MTRNAKGTVLERCGAIIRMTAALTREPEEWEPSDLIQLSHIEATVETVRAAAVHGLRSSGFTDREIAEALGVTQQAVSKRWPGGGRYVGAAGRYRTRQE